MSLLLAAYTPHVFWVWPFVAILLAIALLPLIQRTHHWWEENRSKLIVALALALVTLLYYGFRGTGVIQHEEADEPHPPATEMVEHEPGHEHDPDHAHPEHAEDHDHDHAATAPVHAGEADGAAHADHAGPAGHGAHAEHRTQPGFPTIVGVLHHAVIQEYIPFIVLLFSLYVIAGGIVVRGDLEATPRTNTAIIGTGGFLASFIGTTGSAMLLIRFLLKTNSQRRYKVHTVVFFIFVAANIGGTLLPIGDPPLFLGYLRGVDFLWTLGLWQHWLFIMFAVLLVYYFWDLLAYKRESPDAIKLDHTRKQPIRVVGMLNVVWLIGVVLAVATLDPSKAFPYSEQLFGQEWKPPIFTREVVQLVMAGLSWVTTRMALRRENEFNFVAIGEVACLFIGIFITMQVPIEILNAKGAELGLQHPWQFFWATGILSSFLDNAPTYVVYFATAGTLPWPNPDELMTGVQTASGTIPVPLLVGISCGAVFMGANSYIGNGPNFMVKAIAEQSGVKMPSFFGYMAYSALVLIPLFLLLTLVFFSN